MFYMMAFKKLSSFLHSPCFYDIPSVLNSMLVSEWLSEATFISYFQERYTRCQRTLIYESRIIYSFVDLTLKKRLKRWCCCWTSSSFLLQKLFKEWNVCFMFNIYDCMLYVWKDICFMKRSESAQALNSRENMKKASSCLLGITSMIQGLLISKAFEQVTRMKHSAFLKEFHNSVVEREFFWNCRYNKETVTLSFLFSVKSFSHHCVCLFLLNYVFYLMFGGILFNGM